MPFGNDMMHTLLCCRNGFAPRTPLAAGNTRLGADYFEDPDGTFVSQPKKYIDKLADTYKKDFQ